MGDKTLVGTVVNEQTAKDEGIFEGAIFMEKARAKLHEKYGADVTDEEYFEFMLTVDLS